MGSAQGPAIAIADDDESGQWAVLSVRDPGVGIPDTDLRRIFNRFSRARNVGQIGGSGLGLVVSLIAMPMPVHFMIRKPRPVRAQSASRFGRGDRHGTGESPTVTLAAAARTRRTSSCSRSVDHGHPR